MVEAELVKQTTAHWLRKLSGTVPVAPVHDVKQALDNPLVAERASIQDFAYPDGRRARLIANPIRSAGTEWPRRAAPALGADTDALLKEIGYDAERIARLRAEGVVG
jgi:crotonobetainyl-CoA:carnitine CoA-transferase CaiB-like acyl-CoA transferase